MPQSVDHAAAEQVTEALTAKCLDRVRACASVRVSGLLAANIPVTTALTDDLVADVISDTALGVLPWHPDRCSLAQHLCSHIRSRTAKLRRPQHRRTVPLDQEPFTAEDTGPLEALLSRKRCALLIERLRKDCCKRGDHIAHHVLEAYECGIFRRAEIAHVLGVEAQIYDRARDRIRQRARRLDVFR